MFSKSSEYAIRAMIYVALHSKNQQRVSVKDIAKATDAPEHYIAKIMQELSRRRIVQSIKGPNGGFYLNADDLNTSISDIIKAIDGDSLYIDCVLGMKKCSETNPCPLHHEYLAIKGKLLMMIEKNTIGLFNEKLESGQFFLKNDA